MNFLGAARKTAPNASRPRTVSLDDEDIDDEMEKEFVEDEDNGDYENDFNFLSDDGDDLDDYDLVGQ